MSLFACEECESVENTALCGYVREDNRRKLICSACNPELGKWHDIFPRERYDPSEHTVSNREPLASL